MKFYGQIDASSKFSLESIFNSWFALEYLARFMSCDEKKAFVKNWLNIIDVIAILPYFLMLISGRGNSSGFSSTLKIFRITRIVRIFKLSNYSRSLRILGMSHTQYLIYKDVRLLKIKKKVKYQIIFQLYGFSILNHFKLQLSTIRLPCWFNSQLSNFQSRSASPSLFSSLSRATKATSFTT